MSQLFFDEALELPQGHEQHVDGTDLEPELPKRLPAGDGDPGQGEEVAAHEGHAIKDGQRALIAGGLGGTNDVLAEIPVRVAEPVDRGLELLFQKRFAVGKLRCKVFGGTVSQEGMVHRVRGDFHAACLPSFQFRQIHRPRQCLMEVFPFVFPADPVADGEDHGFLAVFEEQGQRGFVIIG